MRNIEFGDTRLNICDSLSEIMILNKEEFDQYLMLDRAFNPGIENLGANVLNALEYVDKANPEDAKDILKNLYGSIIYTDRNNIPVDNAFYCLIHGATDLHEDLISEKMNGYKREGLLYSQIRDIVYSVSRNFNDEFESFHNALAKSNETTQYYKSKKDWLISVSEEKEDKKKTEAIYKYLLNLQKPENLTVSGKKNPLAQRKMQFGKTLAYISKYTNLDARTMTADQFYNYLEMYIKESQKS